ncbi:putative Mitochondrial Carrier (MC) Family [Phytophthora cinnamomi]|uniref:putative Mitochondrial Carrier (MC) Family n=1 Tax=Phytophthora cinnamomi TaxID=4785 RepID=UPI003559BA4A|nr:putative Mitochondrial Carrier (MC) Family [Phytophthora cinnamomi]KAG6616239.1 putative Mitochondrial Carrier (MC) Family [Phytophthora cinnamomi]
MLLLPTLARRLEVVLWRLSLSNQRQFVRDIVPILKKTSQSVMPACSGGKKRSSTPSVRSVESRASRPSLSGIGLRGANVVSCSHCAKHLIVKNGASAVKCPSCHGVSKMSTTTSKLLSPKR